MRIRRIQQLQAEIRHADWPNQYANTLNSRAHHITMREIVEEVPGRLDLSLLRHQLLRRPARGAEHAHGHRLPVTVVAVDAAGSVIFRERTPSSRLIPGLRSSSPPSRYRDGLADFVVHVTDPG